MGVLTKASYSAKMNQREKNNLKLAYRAACESIVLLENDGVLPLQTKKIALYGSGASRTIKGGSGSGEVNERRSISILEGLEMSGFEVTTKTWIEDYEKIYEEGKEKYTSAKWKKFLSNPSGAMELLADYPGTEGRKISKKDYQESGTDTCVYVLSRQAGEGADRREEKGDYYITDIEKYNIRICAKGYKKFILVINSGAQIDLSFLDEISGINAVLYIGQLGTAGGCAVASVLSGKTTPSGKLSDTWIKSYDDIPYGREYSYLNENLENEDYCEDIYVGYRYFDTFSIEPRYPFGYGLSYTNFSIEVKEILVLGWKIQVKLKVTNIGEIYGGNQVVQMYLSAPEGNLKKEYQSLVAFAKTRKLAPKESQDMMLEFDITEHASYQEESARYILEKGEYLLRVGESSRNTKPCAVFVLAEDVCVSQTTHICSGGQEFEILSGPDSVSGLETDGLPRYTLNFAGFKTKTYTYGTLPVCKNKNAVDFVSELSVEDMAEIVVGAGMFGAKTRFTLPGSVGNTTSKFWDQGLANVALCDGPAGLRIQKRSGLISNKKIKMIDAPMSIYEMIPKIVKNRLLANPKTSTVLYQYTTAFPVSGTLAQSWNTKLMKEIGIAIHEEMKEYGCTFWLAPALNIHRNPLCGRNFEYYSEDPLLTGEMAAAITKGVQIEDGYYVTIKHFACNNQEDNRKRVSSNVSERALREIYLKGFEIAVRKGKAKAVMTSYNKVNGVYTPNSYDLCTRVLRNEWGFDGVVMTDWFATSKGCANAAACITAGNDLIMPGGKSDKKVIVDSVKQGIVDEKYLRRSCLRVVNAIMNSEIQKEYVDKV